MADEFRFAPPPNPLDGFPLFLEAVRGRLLKGREVYGDRSFEAEPRDLLDQISEEVQDTAAWSFILWTRLERLKASLRRGPEYDVISDVSPPVLAAMHAAIGSDGSRPVTVTLPPVERRPERLVGADRPRLKVPEGQER